MKALFRNLKKKIAVRVLALAAAAAVAVPLCVSSVLAKSDTEALETALEEQSAGTQESAGAPPELFTVYFQVGEEDPIEFTSYTGTEMRTIAKKYNPTSTIIKYSAQSYSGTAGRVVKEYIAFTDFFSYVSADVGTLDCESGDYIIWGEDLTKDQDLIDAGYSEDDLKGNWYSYDSIIGTTRYYFPNWSSGSEADAVEVPATIGIRSYGGSSGMTDTYLDYYASSADYLWAYVIYYGQTRYSEYNYPYFYYQQEQMIVCYDEDASVNTTVGNLLSDTIAEAQDLLENTVVDTSSSNVAEGTYWVTQALYTALQTAYDAAKEAAGVSGATNGDAYEAYTALQEAIDDFNGGRYAGTKSGYFWYSQAGSDATTYTITSAQQLSELGYIVRGIASDTSSGQSYDQDSFEGKTILLACDIDMEETSAYIGDGYYAFEGTFDGQGYTISNFRMSATSANTKYSYRGLFAHIGENGMVKNLTVSGTSTVNKANVYHGGISGYNEGTIENVVCDMTVTSLCTYVGGIAGYNTGTITDSVFTASVTGEDYTAGLAAYNAGTIEDSVNAGTAASSSGSTEASVTLAGLCATNAGSVTGCIDTQLSIAGSNAETGSITCSYTLSDTSIVSASGTAAYLYSLGEEDAPDGVTSLKEAEDFTEDAVLNALNATQEDRYQAVTGGYPALSWQEIYTLYFELTLDYNIMDPIQSGAYLPLIEPEDPTAVTYDEEGNLTADSGYRFAGWYADADLTEAFDFTKLLTGDTTAYASWETEYLTGDVNLDGEVTAADAQLVTKYAAGTTDLTDTQLQTADVNGDDAVNTKDAVLIRRYLAGAYTFAE